MMSSELPDRFLHRHVRHEHERGHDQKAAARADQRGEHADRDGLNAEQRREMRSGRARRGPRTASAA